MMTRLLLIKSMVLTIAILAAAPVLSGPPAESGPNVIRYEDGVAFVYVDIDQGIQVILGVNIVEFCTIGADFDLVSILEVSVPEDSNRIKQLLKGDVQASAWAFPEFDCGKYTTELPLGEGMVRIQGTDNDLNVFLNDDNQNANAFGLNANGKIFSATGERLNLKVVDRSVWDGTNPESFMNILRISVK